MFRSFHSSVFSFFFKFFFSILLAAETALCNSAYHCGAASAPLPAECQAAAHLALVVSKNGSDVVARQQRLADRDVIGSDVRRVSVVTPDLTQHTAFMSHQVWLEDRSDHVYSIYFTSSFV